jgi:hypothetical protein
MTFYESNKAIRDTGAEIDEFDDAPPTGAVGNDEAAYDRNLPGSEELPDITEKDTEQE